MTTQTKTTWRKVKLGDFANVNPSVQLQRGKEYPFMDMANVAPLSRTTNWRERKVFTGSGARFDEGDTLFARITPCLENGKITQVLKTGGPGFGSTEFYVLRGKEKFSDSDFIFYLTRTYRIRKLAEASMIGASGRQRVERAAFENIAIEVPTDVSYQKRIADILSAFDDKIELNNKISKNLEATAQAIFKEWFVNFRFPSHEKVKMVDSELGKVPEGWKFVSVEQLAKRLPQGKTYRPEELKQKGSVPVYNQSSGVILGYHDSEPAFSATIDEPVIVFGDHTCRMKLIIHPCSLGPNVVPFIGKSYPTAFIYYLTKEGIVQHEYKRHWTEFEQQEFIVPPIALAEEFATFVKPIVQKMVGLENENQKLAALRDLLLPKLMKGEIKV